jgi:hypothetical protein
MAETVDWNLGINMCNEEEEEYLKVLVNDVHYKFIPCISP